MQRHNAHNAQPPTSDLPPLFPLQIAELREERKEVRIEREALQAERVRALLERLSAAAVD